MTTFRRIANQVVETIGLTDLKGAGDSDKRMAAFVIRMCVAKAHMEGSVLVTREQLLGELRLAIQRRSATCTVRAARALDEGCQWLLMGSLSGSGPCPPVEGFLLQWRLHQRAAETLLDGLRGWYNETVPVPTRTYQMSAQLDAVFLLDARFLKAMIPVGFSPAKLVLALHEGLVVRGLGTGDKFAWLLCRTVYHLFEKTVFSVGVFWEDASGPAPSYDLLAAAEPYRAVCEAVVLECERACTNGPSDMHIEHLKARVPAVAELIQRGALAVGGTIPQGYDSAHMSLALLGAGERRWGPSPGRLEVMVLQLGCVCALGVGPMDKYGGLPMPELLQRIERVKTLAGTLVQETVAICSKFTDDARRARAVVLAVRLVEQAGPIRSTMLETQRRLSRVFREGFISRASDEAFLLWGAFYRITGESLFHAPECSAAAGAPLPRSPPKTEEEDLEAIAEFAFRSAVSACSRYRDPRKLESALDLPMEVIEMSGAPMLRLGTLVRQRIHLGTRAGMLLCRVVHTAGDALLCPQADYDAVLNRGVQLREEKAVRMCERVAALYASEGVRPALAYVRIWLRSRRMGFDRVAHQRAAIAAALRLPEGVPDWHPGVPIVIAEAFRSVYQSPLFD